MGWTQGLFWFTLISVCFTTPDQNSRRYWNYTNLRLQASSPSRRDYVTEMYQVTNSRTPQYERSLPTSSGLQRLEEQARRKYLGVRIEGTSPRYRNVTKLHNNRKVYPSIGSRIGETHTDGKLFVPVIPEECKQAGICTEVPNYPRDYIDNLIKELGTEIDKYKVEELEPDIVSRLGTNENFVELCSYRNDIVIPDAARDKDDKWHFILNRKNGPLQGYKAEICIHQRKSCNTELVSIASGYESLCQQKYTERVMTGIDENGNKIDKPFKLPSCCNCVLRKL